MNRFMIVDCTNLKEDDYNGMSIVLACTSDPEFVLFFPVPKEISKMIKYIMDEDNEYDIDTNILGIYKTMVDSWKSTGKYLSGVILDSIYNPESKDEGLVVRLALADNEGDLDSLVNINFLHAMVLAVMEKVDIVVCDSLLDKMGSDDDEDEEHDVKIKRKPQHFPEDKKIMEIAKKIMSGKVKNK